jgi:hypothetical protein
MAYDKEIVFPLILSEIEEGASLRSILRRDEMPNQNTFFDWLYNDENKSKQYARACELRSESIFEDILEIADETSGDKKYTESGEVIDSEYVARSRIKIDARKWMLGKMNPKKYGDKMDLTSDGEKIQNNQAIQIEIIRPNLE